MKYTTTNDVQAALERAARKGQKYYLVIKTLAETGVRVSELINIRPRDLNDDQTLIVNGKGGKIRVIDMPGELYNLLQLYIKEKKIRNSARMFPFSRRAIGYLTNQLIEKNPHAFRHGYAIQLLRTTKNIRYVQKQLGHSSLDMTSIYLQFMDYEKEKIQLAELYR